MRWVVVILLFGFSLAAGLTLSGLPGARADPVWQAERRAALFALDPEILSVQGVRLTLGREATTFRAAQRALLANGWRIWGTASDAELSVVVFSRPYGRSATLVLHRRAPSRLLLIVRRSLEIRCRQSNLCPKGSP